MFQIDLIVPMVVQGIEMQGWDDGNDKRLVKMYALEYGMDENNLTRYRENANYEKVCNLLVRQYAQY